MKTEQKKSLYAQFLIDNEVQEEKEIIAKQMGKEKDNIVIQKVSTGGKLIEKIVDTFYLVGKITFSVILILLLSLSATVLLNGELRETVLTQLFGFL